VLAATAAALVPQQPAAAAPASSTITVFLKAPQPAALDRLALRHDLSRTARLAALRTLVPNAATHASVTGLLARSGYRVIDQTSWSITAVGGAAASARLFGTRPVAHAPRAAVTGALPRVPQQLQSSVAAVFPTTGGPAAFHHATSTLDGSAFRNAYTPAHVAPPSGQHDGSATVATLQLANFYGPTLGNFNNSRRAADLTTYARRHHISDPVNGAAKRYTAVKVDGGPRARDDNANGNTPDVEVDLDQQSILSTAPSAHQQAYFAPNTDAGYNDVFAHVYDDVVGNGMATHKNPNIVAMSVSWGGCEGDTGRKAIMSLEPILKSLVAAGVTVFASAGDNGIYDCYSNTKASVDYPGSSPSVVSVGGTHLSAGANRPNTGSNWTETAWTCSGLYTCSSGGTGGGRSSMFAAPVYQRAGIDDAPFRNNARRLVPDIAANASPKTGFRIYTSNPEVYDFDQCLCHTPAIGGTSMSAPVSAASLTNALAARGRSTGVGDIHGPLYSAYRNTHNMPNGDARKAVRDIVRGQNGNPADRGSDPSVSATRGYDTVTGVGAVHWPAVMRFVFTKGAPTKPDVHVGLLSAHSAEWRTIRASWTVSRGHDLRLLGATHVVVRRLGAATNRADLYTYPASGERSFTGSVPGATYQVTVQGQDLGHHRSPVATRTVQVPLDDSRLAHDRRWTRVTNRADIGGSHLAATARGAYLHAGGFGRAYAVRVHVGPDGGRLAISRNGHRLQVLNLHAARPGIRTVEFYRSSSRASRTFGFSDLSGAVNLDAVWITY
jgi:kumamolisin